MQIELVTAAKLIVGVIYSKRPLSDKLGEVAPDSQDTRTLQANANRTAGSSKAHSKFSFY